MDSLHVQVGDVALAVESEVDFLVGLRGDAQLGLDVLLVQGHKHRSTQESIKGKDHAWKCWHDAHGSGEESENTGDSENEADEVWLEHVNCDAGLQQELKESDQVESEEKEAELLAVLSSHEIQVNLRENEAHSNDLSHNESTLVESILAPALHGKSLDDGEGNLVVVLGEAEGAVGVGQQGQYHAQHVEVIAVLELDESADGEEEWSEVDLDGVEVTDVGNVEVAEHADDAVGEDNEGEALVGGVLLLQELGDEAGEREEEHHEDHADSGDGLVDLLHVVEHVELPASEEHLSSRLVLHDHLRKSNVESSWAHLSTWEGGISLLWLLTLEINSGVIENLLQDKSAHNGIDGNNNSKSKEHWLHLGDGEGEEGQSHPELVAL